jgi:hypothetical protein
MPTIYVRLDPRKLEDPDTDLRYTLPDLIREESCGEVKDDGYDYVGEVPFLLLFLNADNVDRGLTWVLSVLEHDTTLGNDFLKAAVVAVESDGRQVVEYPKDYAGEFPV